MKKLIPLTTAAAAVALLAGAAHAQQMPAQAPTPGSVTGDWNGAHAPTDDKQYQDKMTVPVVGAAPADQTAGSVAAMPAPAASTDVTAGAPSASTYAQGASFTATTLTNGPVPDTPENRRKYGQPMSHAGKRTAAAGN